MSEAVEICEREGMPWTPIVLALKAQMELKKGAWASARPTLDEACRLPLEGAWDGIALGHRLLGLAYMGSEETGSILAKRDSYLPTAGIDGRAGQWYYAMALGEAAAYLGMKRESAMTYPLLRQLMEEGAVTLLSLGLVEKVAGIAAAAGGDWESSERHFEAALGQAETLPVEIEEPDVRRWYAWMLRERSGPGDEEKSRSVLDAAKAGYAKLGMAEFVELVEKDFE